MVIIDSSCWVHYFRYRGDARVRARVSHLLQAGEAAWCPMVRLELWNGVGSEADRRMLREHEVWLPDLAITDDVWNEACALASRCRKAGKTAPANDVLIAACARHYEVGLEYTDAHFDFLMAL
jgi:predicted nucleic acid-binding protein